MDYVVRCSRLCITYIKGYTTSVSKVGRVMTRTREITRNIIAACVSLFIFAPIVWFAVIDREPPFIRLGGYIEQQQPKPEDFITVHWQVRQLRNDCRPVGPRALTRTIIDGGGQVIDFDAVDLAYDGSSPIVRSVQIPRGATPGASRYRSNACFVCGNNPFHYVWPICVGTPEILFDIGKP